LEKGWLALCEWGRHEMALPLGEGQFDAADSTPLVRRCRFDAGMIRRQPVRRQVMEKYNGKTLQIIPVLFFQMYQVFTRRYDRGLV
jgi:hypothetical protein